MDWNELIRIWGAGHPGEEPRIDEAAEGARRARSRRRSRMARAEEGTYGPRHHDRSAAQGGGDEMRA